MSDSFAGNLLHRRGNRASATILSWAEAHFRDVLTPDQWQEFRGVVLVNVSDFKDLAVDMINSDTGGINEFWATELSKLHEAIARL